MQNSLAGVHPRLYFTSHELARLVAARSDDAVRRRMWDNLFSSAEWCLTRPLRRTWIPPVSPNPIYENLYDRFYAMMHDMAVMEHLAFAWAYSKDARYFEAAKAWTLACVRIWGHEAEGEPDANKAYAVLRLLKGVATAYDMIHERLGEQERDEIRDMLTQVGGKYYQWYVDAPGYGTVRNEANPAGQGPHHASVEAASFGIAALALLGECPQAEDWLNLMVQKHRQSLLPHALEPDGAQREGPTFWASTMQYRIAFMDALRRVTGEDLFREFRQQMDDRLALASVTGNNNQEYPSSNESVILSPSYAQLGYYSPVLLYLARQYRRPIDQHLALWDHNLGAIQKTRYITDSGEMMLFAWGGHAYAWYDPTVAPEAPPDTPLSFAFPSVGEAYLRESFQPNGIVAATKRGRVFVNIGPNCILSELDEREYATMDLADDGQTATLMTRSASATQNMRLERRKATLTIDRVGAPSMSWRSNDLPQRFDNRLTWNGNGSLEVMEGRIDQFESGANAEPLVVGCGLLDLTENDPKPRSNCIVRITPSADGKLVLRISGGNHRRTERNSDEMVTENRVLAGR